jgi:APA family basic amino acid/polyamine antiporter
VVRRKYKNNGDNYKVWGYPFVPIIFILLSIWMIHFTIVGNTKVSLIGFGTALSGLIFYYFSPKKINKKNNTEASNTNNLKRFNDTNDYQ